MCQCIPVERLSRRCIRYIPTLRIPVSGSRVLTIGSVTNAPPSASHECNIGRRSRSTSSPCHTTCWQAPRPATLCGNHLATSANRGSARIFSHSEPLGESASFKRESIRAEISSSRSTPRAIAMRREEPIIFVTTGNSVPVFSKRSALPPSLLTTRSVSSAISKRVLTGAEMRMSSPSRSRRSIYSRRLLYIAIGF